MTRATSTHRPGLAGALSSCSADFFFVKIAAGLYAFEFGYFKENAMSKYRIRVLVFVSEILSAKTLVPIIGALRSDPEFCVRIVNDGFCMELVQTLGRPVTYILDDFEASATRPVIRA